MKKLIASILFVFASLVTAQEGSNYTIKGTPLDVITDAKNIAMGESFVAYNSSPNSFLENPAAISPNNFSFFYNYRYHGWNSMYDDMGYFNTGFSLSTSIGKFGVSFGRFTTGDYSFPDNGTSVTVNMKRSAFSFCYAYPVINNFTVGGALKLFSTSTSNSGGANYESDSNTPVLFDLGLLYEIKNLISLPGYDDKLNLGISVQNIGNQLEEKYKFYPEFISKNDLAEYARIGFAYETKMVLGEKIQANVDITLTGEYYTLLNPGSNDKSNVDYWGAGTELKLFNIIALRAGVVVPPTQSVLHERGKLNWRYGAGLNYPFNVWGLPLSINFDYAYIPIEYENAEISYFDGSTTKIRENLYAFSFSLTYNGRFF